MRKKSYYVGLLLVVLSLGVFAGIQIDRHLFQLNSESTKIHVQYGDNFSVFDIRDYNGDAYNLVPANSNYLLVFYLDTKCGDCYKQLEIIDRCSKAFNNQVDVAVLWGGDIPNQNYGKLNIEKSQLYSLNGTFALSSSPAAFIIDTLGNVIFQTTELDKVTSKILSLDGIKSELVLENTNTYLTSLFNKTDGKTPVIYFAMDGCKDCAAADSIIDTDILNKYSFVRIYTADSYGEQDIVDIDDILSSIYGIDWYPSFLILNDSPTVLGKDTPAKELKKAFMSIR